MAYLRLSYSNWYVYWTFEGRDVVKIWHVREGMKLYDFNSDIDSFIKREFNNVSKEDKEELKEALIEANQDYNKEKGLV